MKYQDIVYKCPGPHQRKGGTYAFRGVSSPEEHDQALQEGWFNTLPEAIEGKVIDVPPTRDELEQKAKELGVKFDKKTPDDVLAKKIEAILEA